MNASTVCQPRVVSGFGVMTSRTRRSPKSRLIACVTLLGRRPT